MFLQNAQLEKELELLRREYEDKEREWETENTDLKNEVSGTSTNRFEPDVDQM